MFYFTRNHSITQQYKTVMIQQCSDTSSPQHSRPTNGQATADVALVFRATTIGLHTYYDIQELQLAKKCTISALNFENRLGAMLPGPILGMGYSTPYRATAHASLCVRKGVGGVRTPPIGNQKFSSSRGVTIMSCLCVRYSWRTVPQQCN